MIEDYIELAVKPFILIVEDRKDLRELESFVFKGLGCSVIVASNPIDALKTFLSSPQLDLIFTDIDLLADYNKHDKSGVDIARLIRQLNPEIPIVGYSSKFSEQELTKNEISCFNRWYDKGSMDSIQLSDMFTEVTTMATLYKQNRFNLLRNIIDNVRMENGTNENYENESKFIISQDYIPKIQIDETLKETGFELYRVKPLQESKIKKDFVVWQKREDNYCEMEIYGYPNLWSVGLSEEEALINLFVLMRKFYSDFKKIGLNEISTPISKQFVFLNNIFC